MAGTGLGVSVPNVTPGGGSNLIFVPKTTSETLASNVTPQADDELFKLLPIGNYWMEAYLRVSNGLSASGFRYRWDHDLSGNLSYNLQTVYRINGGNENYQTQMTIGAPGSEVNQAAVPTAATYAEFWVRGPIFIQTAAKTIQLMWAQSVSQTTNTGVIAGSWMSFMPMVAQN